MFAWMPCAQQQTLHDAGPVSSWRWHQDVEAESLLNFDAAAAGRLRQTMQPRTS